MWKLTETGRQPDANLVQLPARQCVRTEPDLDVLQLVVAGHGTLGTSDRNEPLASGALFWLPHGSTCRITAGVDGLSGDPPAQLRPHATGQRGVDLFSATHQKPLMFVFVDACVAGVEVLAELEDMADDACRHCPGVEPGQMHWVLVEATDRILPEGEESMSRYTADLLRGRGIDLCLNTRLLSAVVGHVVLDDCTVCPAGTLGCRSPPHRRRGGFLSPLTSRLLARRTRGRWATAPPYPTWLAVAAPCVPRARSTRSGWPVWSPTTSSPPRGRARRLPARLGCSSPGRSSRSATWSAPTTDSPRKPHSARGR